MFPLITNRLNASGCFILVLFLSVSFLPPTLPASAAGPAYLVKDIQTTATRNDNSFAQGAYAIGNIVYFFAFEPNHGVELWKSDGTDSGTVLVRDINLGWAFALRNTSQGIESPQFTNIGETLFFVVDDGSYGHELWRSDGTEQGTNIVKDIYPGATGSNPTELMSVGETLFFVANDGVHGTELWRSDGTEQGTTIEDMSPGITDSYVFDLTAVGNELFFGALVRDSESSYSFAIWKTDATETGIVKVHTLTYPCRQRYQDDTLANALTNVQGKLFFVNCIDSSERRELWQSDGADNGTSKLTDLQGYNYEFNDRTVVGDTLFFRDHDQLWKSDGTAAGTVFVKGVKPSNLTSVNNTLYFVGDDGANGSELWRSDGSPDGTVIVKDINPGATGSNPINITPFHEGVVFAADDGTHGYELWRSDGSENGTNLVQDIYAGSAGAFYSGSVRYPWTVTANGTLFFPPNDDIIGSELWRSDGTAEGTMLVKDIVGNRTDGIPYYTASNKIDVNGVSFFTAFGDGTGQELWRSDGREEGTFLVKDIAPGTQSSYPYYLTNANGTLFFIANDGVHGRELWRSDGTEEGTIMVSNIAPESQYASVDSVASLKDVVCFTAYVFGQGYSLWRSDGTAAGTIKLKDIGSSSLTTVNDEILYITADSSQWQLWKSDGTIEGTTLIKTVSGHSGYYSRFTLAKGIMFFAIIRDNGYYNGSYGPGTYELWRSDGTAGGTILLRTFRTTSGDYRVLDSIQALGNKIYFAGADSYDGGELWSSDGTEEGTLLVADIYPGSASSAPKNLVSINNTLLFSAISPGRGRELWRSDGTEAGTVLVKDIMAGPLGSNATPLLQIDGTLFFTADDGISGTELWRSDGNSTGTTLLQDIAPGGASSAPSDLTVSNGRLFFTADDQVYGYELWALRLADLPAPPATATATSSPSPTASSTATETPADGATATSTTTATTTAIATPSSTPEIPITSLRNHLYMPHVAH